MLYYKRARQSRQRVVRIQSALCNVACEQNDCGLKIAIVKIAKDNEPTKHCCSYCGVRGISLNSGTQDSADNKEFN